MAKKQKNSFLKRNAIALLATVILLPILIYAVYQQINIRSRAFDAGYIPMGFSKSLKLTNLPGQTTASLEVPYVKGFRWQDVWTIEGWFKPENIYPSTPTQQLFYIPLKMDEYGLHGTGLYITNGQLYGEYEQPLVAGTLNAGTISSAWHHIAFVNDGKYCFLFVDGIQKAKTTGSQCMKNDTDPAQLIVERITVGSKLVRKLISMGNYEIKRVSGFVGQIDEFRMIPGIARYTANFTRPTQPFPEKSDFVQYRFDAIGTNNTIAPAGYDVNQVGFLRDTRFQLTTSTIPYIPPPSTITPTPTSTPSATPTATPTPLPTGIRPPPVNPFY